MRGVPAEGVDKDLLWTLSLLSFWSVAIESRVTADGQGFGEGEASPQKKISEKPLTFALRGIIFISEQMF